jgi:hypothetical protein
VKSLEQRVAALEKQIKKMLASKHKLEYDSVVGEMQKKGGRARAEKLTAERRREIAQAAAAARWKSRGAK